MSEELQESQEQDIETTQDVSETVDQEVDQEADQEAIEEKPKSGYIDYNVLPEDVRDTVKMRVDGDFRKIKEAERREREYQKKMEEYEQKLSELNKPKEVDQPTEDDWLDDPERAKKKQDAYIDFIRKDADWQKQSELRQQQVAVERSKQQKEKLDTFVSKSESVGINQHELGYAASVVQSELGEDVQDFLVSHDHGPQLLMHLAKNPMELKEIASLNPYQVGAKLDNLAKAFKPARVTKAPPPDDPIQGSGVDSREEYNGLLKGAQFL